MVTVTGPGVVDAGAEPSNSPDASVCGPRGSFGVRPPCARFPAGCPDCTPGTRSAWRPHRAAQTARRCRRRQGWDLVRGLWGVEGPRGFPSADQGPGDQRGHHRKGTDDHHVVRWGASSHSVRIEAHGASIAGGCRNRTPTATRCCPIGVVACPAWSPAAVWSPVSLT